MKERYEDQIKNPNIKPWKCSSCGCLLAFVEKGEVVRIKRQDVYVQCSGGDVTVCCFRCAKINTLTHHNDDVVNLREQK